MPFFRNGSPKLTRKEKIVNDCLTVNERISRLGITRKSFIEKVMLTGVCASYSWIDKHCRSWSRDYGSPEVWEVIDRVLEELEGTKNE